MEAARVFFFFFTTVLLHTSSSLLQYNQSATERHCFNRVRAVRKLKAACLFSRLSFGKGSIR